MAQVEVVSEREMPTGWSFDLQAIGDDGSLVRSELTLSWADYNLWSASGRDQPVEVASAVVQFLMSRSPAAELRPVFDASLVRRLHDDADAALPGFISDRR